MKGLLIKDVYMLRGYCRVFILLMLIMFAALIFTDSAALCAFSLATAATSLPFSAATKATSWTFLLRFSKNAIFICSLRFLGFFLPLLYASVPLLARAYRRWNVNIL